MTMKLEDIASYIPFGYGMIAKTLSTNPETEVEPVIVFIHKNAAAGKYHDGKPVLTAREEKAMMKDVDTLVALLNKFNHIADDLVKVPDSYNKPKGPRKPRTVKTEIVPEAAVEIETETPTEEVEVEPVAEVETKPNRRRKKKDAEETTPTMAEIVPATTVERERELSASVEAPADQPKMERRKPDKPAKTESVDGLFSGNRRTVRRNIERTSKASGKTVEIAVEVKRKPRKKQTETI